ncbi:hypothetical protein DH2020_025368 [Rehmannia glutinosa]|uniref:Lachrymatory-factor synthase n=1 Tax=Rehmannia glutinosa TaxID=99300 RepID=A0ABR0W2L0_REHGL
MDQKNLTQKKWEAKVSTRLEQARPEQIWPLFEDFFGLQKYFPGLATCHGIEGANGQPGCIRYCSGFGLKPKGNNNEPNSNLRWSKERLLDVDPIGKWLSYEVLDNNMGLKTYKSTIKVLPIDGGDDSNGCLIEWSFLADPVEGFSYEDLVNYLDISLQGMAQNMEKAILESC